MFKRFIVGFMAALLVTVPASAGWVEGSVIGVRDDNSKHPIALFINTYTGHGMEEFPPDTWGRLDVTQFGVPEDALAISLSGLLIITHGVNSQICDVHIAFRAPGNDLHPGSYLGQTIEAVITSGQRSNMQTWVPVKDGAIELNWHGAGLPATWPSYCAYGINLSLQAYVR